MNEKTIKEAKQYIDHITLLNTSKAFLRGFICGLKGIVEEDELDIQIAYELDVPNFKSGYFDGIKFYVKKDEKLELMLEYANSKLIDTNVKSQNPIQSLMSNINELLNTNNQFIDLSKINEKVSSQDLTGIDPKDLMTETEKLQKDALDIGEQIKNLEFPSLSILTETLEEPKKDSNGLKNYSVQ